MPNYEEGWQSQQPQNQQRNVQQPQNRQRNNHNNGENKTNWMMWAVIILILIGVGWWYKTKSSKPQTKKAKLKETRSNIQSVMKKFLGNGESVENSDDDSSDDEAYD